MNQLPTPAAMVIQSFAQALLNGPSNEDHDQFRARELFDDYILTAVTANSKQEPQFRHDRGDVILVRTEN